MLFFVRTPCEVFARRPGTLTDKAEQTPVAGRFVPQEQLLATARIRLMLASELGSERTMLLREVVSPDKDPSFAERFQREADLLMALDHPSIPRLVDTAQEGNRYFLVHEFVGGEPLIRYREQNPDQVKARAEAWINALAEVLVNLHERTPAFVVGDFGPEDILVTAMGRLRFLPLRRENLQSPDSLEDEVPQVPAEPPEIPQYFDVHRLVGLAWWMLTGKVPVMGQAPEVLDPANYPDLTPEWLRGLQAALDPAYPDPPQTINQLRMLLLGKETVSSERPPKMVFEVADIRHLKGQKGRIMVQGTLRVRNVGGGELNGYCRSTQRWVRILPTAFQGNQIDLEFWIDSSGMRASEEHRAHVFLRSQNSEVDIPVLVTTPPHWLSLLPNFLAAIIPLVPGILATIVVCLVLLTGLRGAESALAELNGGPLGSILSDTVLHTRIPPGNSAPINARVSATIALACFALCPMAVRSIVKRYPRNQANRFVLFEIVGLVAPLIMLPFIWNRPVFNHLAMTHPDFAVLDLKGANLWKCVLVNLVFTVWCFSPLQRQLEQFFVGRESLRETVKWLLNGFLVLVLASVMFSR